MTAFDDDELARALARVPVGEYAPIDRLRGRARQLHVRRRLGGGGLALAAVVLVAVPSALALGGDGDVPTPAPPAGDPPGPFPTDNGPTHCPVTYDDRLTAIQPIDTVVDLADPGALPPAIRLLWDESAAPPPTEASAISNTGEAAAVEAEFEQCPRTMDLSVLIVQSADGVVERSVRVIALGDHDPTGAEERVIDAGEAQIRVATNSGMPAGTVNAVWEDAEGMTWNVTGDSLTDDELVELVQTMETEGDEVDVSAWSVARDAEQIIQRIGVMDRPATYSYSAAIVTPGGTAPLQLMVDDDNRTRWIEALPGTREVDVAGVPGLLSEDGGGQWRLTWQPDPASTATLYGGDDPDELLAIAETVGQVPAQDPRLVDAWTPR